MVKTDKIRIFTLAVFSVLFCFGSRAEDALRALPYDLPNIELLIDAHKKMREAEDLAVLQIKSIHYEHQETLGHTKKFKKYTDILHKRMSDIGGWITFASMLAKAADRSITLADAYKDFTVNTYKYCLKNPLVMGYYTEANFRLSHEIPQLAAKITEYSLGSVSGVLKSTMEEKYRLMTYINKSLSRLEFTIWQANRKIKTSVNKKIKSKHINEILTPEIQQATADKIKEKWKEKA